jgi:hypothetical protein
MSHAFEAFVAPRWRALEYVAAEKSRQVHRGPAAPVLSARQIGRDLLCFVILVPQAFSRVRRLVRSASVVRPLPHRGKEKEYLCEQF